MSAFAVQVDGVFDLRAASRLCEALLAAPPDAELHLDFSRVRDFRDNAIAVLYPALGQVGRRVSIAGLTQHQLRLLQYLGAPAEGAAAH